MKKRFRNEDGILTVEACIAFTIFMIVILTILFIMRIVYVQALMQHAAMQTAKELSGYTYIYQVSGLNELQSDIKKAQQSGVDAFNEDVGNFVKLYKAMESGRYEEIDINSLNLDPVDVVENMVAVAISEGTEDVNNLMFENISKAMMVGYISPDNRGDADKKLRQLGVVGGLSGVHFDKSSFFVDDKQTIDIVVYYTVDPLLPVDLLGNLTFTSRATVRAFNGRSVV